MPSHMVFDEALDEPVRMVIGLVSATYLAAASFRRIWQHCRSGSRWNLLNWRPSGWFTAREACTRENHSQFQKAIRGRKKAALVGRLF